MSETKTHPALEALLAFDVRPLLLTPGRYDVLPQGRAAGQTIHGAIPQLEALLTERSELFDAATELLALIDDSLDYCADSGPNFPMRLSQETGRLQAAVDACKDEPSS